MYSNYCAMEMIYNVFVQCEVCGATGKSFTCPDNPEEEDWETAECDSAISAWNLRKGDQETITESVNEKPLQEEQQTSFMENEETI